MSTEDPTVAPVGDEDGVDEPSEADGGPGPSSGSGGWKRWLLGMLVATIVLAVLVKTFLLQAFYIPSTSMEPGLEVGDRIVVQKISTWFDGPERGDVVVFEDPGGWLGAQADEEPGLATRALGAIGVLPAGGHLVKRVVGVEGDVVECCDDQGRILVNGVPLDEDDYLRSDDLACNGPMTGTCTWTAGPVPEGEVFVMGDNRNSSGDSTTHLCTEMETDCTDDPFVSDDLVVGTVLATVWPRDRFGSVDNDPDSFDEVLDAP